MIDRVEKEVELIERHLDILTRVIENEPIGIVKLSDQGGYAHHKVRYSLRVLEEDGLVRPTDQGAVTTDRTTEFVGHIDNQLSTFVERLDAIKIGNHVESNH